jgi:F0F1-type ATP synthase alpha subunit
VILVAAMAHLFQNVPIKKIGEVRGELLTHIHTELPELCREIDEKGQLTDEAKQQIIDSAKAFIETCI